MKPQATDRALDAAPESRRAVECSSPATGSADGVLALLGVIYADLKDDRPIARAILQYTRCTNDGLAAHQLLTMRKLIENTMREHHAEYLLPNNKTEERPHED